MGNFSKVLPLQSVAAHSPRNFSQVGYFFKSPPVAAPSYMAILIRGNSSKVHSLQPTLTWLFKSTGGGGGGDSSKVLQFQSVAAHSPRKFSQVA